MRFGEACNFPEVLEKEGSTIFGAQIYGALDCRWARSEGLVASLAFALQIIERTEDGLSLYSHDMGPAPTPSNQCFTQISAYGSPRI